jgi:dihydroxyacetone kinase
LIKWLKLSQPVNVVVGDSVGVLVAVVVNAVDAAEAIVEVLAGVAAVVEAIAVGAAETAVDVEAAVVAARKRKEHGFPSRSWAVL